ncbi:MAG: DUF1127 domain-containing protein [Alphaproteobacteria bacterium]
MSKNTDASIAAAFAPARPSNVKPNAFAEFRARIVQAVQDWAKSRRQRHTVNLLMALDDNQLKDIGLTRSEILSTVYGPNNTPFTRVHPYY